MIIKSTQIVGASSVKTLATDTTKGKWVQLLAPSTNGSNVLIGGSEVSATVGFPLIPGSSQFFPSVSDMFEFYQLAKCYAYVASGDVLDVLYGVEGSNS